MTKRTYWIKFPRGFANEYIIGIATSRTARGDYEEEGFERIPRERALRELTYRGDAATRAYVGASVDGCEQHDRFAVARRLREIGPAHG